MNSVVCNAGPLIALTGIGQAGILRELFGEVLVSRKVREKVEAGGPSGTGRLLTEAKKAGLVTAVRPLIDQMRAHGYWLSDKIVAEILRQAEE